MYFLFWTLWKYISYEISCNFGWFIFSRLTIYSVFCWEDIDPLIDKHIEYIVKKYRPFNFCSFLLPLSYFWHSKLELLISKIVFITYPKSLFSDLLCLSQVFLFFQCFHLYVLQKRDLQKMKIKNFWKVLLMSQNDFLKKPIVLQKARKVEFKHWVSLIIGCPWQDLVPGNMIFLIHFFVLSLMCNFI